MSGGGARPRRSPGAGPKVAGPPRSARARLVPGLLWSLTLVACGPSQPDESRAGGSGAQAPAGGAPEAVTARPTRDVLDATLSELGAARRDGVLSARELRGDTGLLPEEVADAGDQGEAPAVREAVGAPPLDPEAVEFRDGLLGMVASDPRYLQTALADVTAAADDLRAPIAAGLREDRAPAELETLCRFARAAPGPEGTDALLALAASHDQPSVRTFAAWALVGAAGTERGAATVPELLRRLKYEKDPGAVVWIARALAAQENLSGLPTLAAIASAGGDQAQVANEQLYEVVRLVLGRDEVTADDANGVMEGWRAGRADRSTPAPDRLRAELWRLVSDLSGEHFQLRGVDDARFILSRLGPWSAAEFAAALEDDDPYVRLHVAQVLERMGPRGAGAAGSLEAALLDGSDAVAGAAAEALAAVAPGTAAAALTARLDGTPPHEVRVALVRGLGRTEAPPVDRLLGVFRSQGGPVDLRLAAAEGLLAAGEASPCLPWLASTMTRRFGDPAGAEALAGRWVAGCEGEGADALREAWGALGPQQAIIHTAEQAADRRARRAALLVEHLGADGGSGEDPGED